MKRMKNWAKTLLITACTILLTVSVVPAQTSETAAVAAEPRLAIMEVNGICTGQVLKARLLQTASHCVGLPGAEVTLIFTHPRTNAKFSMKGIVVWDGRPIYEGETYHELIDLAFVALPVSWPFIIELDTQYPEPGTEALNISFSIGFPYYTVPLKVVGVFDRDDDGLVIAYRGEAMPGASGSLVLVNGKGVGEIIKGTNFIQPPLMWGPTAKRIVEAMSDLAERGEMAVCKVNNKSQICRPKVRTQ